jgi:hypothetical protein
MGDSGSAGSRRALVLDSMDCADTALSFGAAVRRKGGDGEFGWLRYGETLATQNEKLASVCSW